MDEGNSVAERALEAALRYLDKNSEAIVGKKSAVEVDGGEAQVTVERGSYLYLTIFFKSSVVCAELDLMLDAGSPPDLLLDLTKVGIASEVVKSLSVTLGLPTVASAYGEEGDIK